MIAIRWELCTHQSAATRAHPLTVDYTHGATECKNALLQQDHTTRQTAHAPIVPHHCCEHDRCEQGLQSQPDSSEATVLMNRLDIFDDCCRHTRAALTIICTSRIFRGRSQLTRWLGGALLLHSGMRMLSSRTDSRYCPIRTVRPVHRPVCTPSREHTAHSPTPFGSQLSVRDICVLIYSRHTVSVCVR